MKDVLKNLPPLVDTVTFATKIDEVKSSYGGGGYDMVVVTSHEII